VEEYEGHGNEWGDVGVHMARGKWRRSGCGVLYHVTTKCVASTTLYLSNKMRFNFSKSNLALKLN